MVPAARGLTWLTMLMSETVVWSQLNAISALPEDTTMPGRITAPNPRSQEDAEVAQGYQAGSDGDVTKFLNITEPFH